MFALGCHIANDLIVICYCQYRLQAPPPLFFTVGRVVFNCGVGIRAHSLWQYGFVEVLVTCSLLFCFFVSLWIDLYFYIFMPVLSLIKLKLKLNERPLTEGLRVYLQQLT